jgi:hypothetical protein
MQFPSQLYLGKDPHEGSFMKGVVLFATGLVIGAALVFLAMQAERHSFEARTQRAAHDKWHAYFSSPASPPPRDDAAKSGPIPTESAGPLPE